MAICKDCNQEMLTGKGCTVSYDDEKRRMRIRFGEEAWTPRSPALDVACHDCGVSAGDYHHPGCDMEKCAACGEQRISCLCTPNPTWQCPNCRTDLERVGVIENRTDINAWTKWKLEAGRWNVNDEDNDGSGTWSLECAQCQTELPYELRHALWDDMSKSWNG